MSSDLSYFYTFWQSNLLEIPVYFLVYRWLAGKEMMTFAKVAAVTTLANAFTHPWVFFGFMGVGVSYLVSVPLAECFAVFGEAPLQSYALGPKFKITLLASLLANLFSWQVAPIITYVLFF